MTTDDDMKMEGPAMLAKWLADNKESAHAFGLRLGVDPGIVRDLVRGDIRNVRVELAAKIEDATGIGMRTWIPTEKPVVANA